MIRKEIRVNSTKREELISINNRAAEFVKNSPKCDGILNIFIPHTTAAVTINENADPDVKTDLIFALQQVAPILKEFRHTEGNSDAHLKSSLLGCSIQVPFYKGKLELGIWQDIYFCEFDGPRNRRVILSIF